MDSSHARVNGDPGGSRTPNPQIRSLMLYPVELRGRAHALILTYYVSTSNRCVLFALGQCPTAWVARSIGDRLFYLGYALM